MLLVLFVVVLSFILIATHRVHHAPLKIYENVFSKSDFERLKKIVCTLRLYEDPRISSRTSTCISYETDRDIYDLVYQYFPSAQNPPSYPIEYRKYNTGSKGMDMHSDLAIYDDTEYYEAVLTVENTSDSRFMYYDTTGRVRSIWLPPNSLVLVKPNTVVHGVGPVSIGYRTILKFIVGANCKGKENSSFYNELKSCPKIY